MVEKTIGAPKGRRQFGKVLQEVVAKGDKFVVERHGEAVAALVPMEVYRQWKGARREFFAQLSAASQAADLSSAEADNLAEEAVSAVRTFA